MNIQSFLAQYVKFKSVSCEDCYLHEMKLTREFLGNFLHESGLNVQEITTEKHNILLAKNVHKNDRKTILFYGHYDVQPAEEKNWNTDPFVLTEHNGRLYARGASDNKGGNATFLAALHDIMSESSDFPLNIIVVLDGEEEIGSPSMVKFLRDYRDELHADFAIIADTWSIDDENIVITTGLRGLVGFELKLCSAECDLHSGYGGTIINPIRELIKLCNSFYTSEGLVNIDGFYDDVVKASDFEQSQIRKLPFTDLELLPTLGAKKLSNDNDQFSAINSMRFYPTLELNGITGGYQGNGLKTIIPHEASVKVTCRLVNNQSANKIKSVLEKAISERIDKNVKLFLNFETASNPYNLLDNKDCFDSSTAIGYAIDIAKSEINNVFGKEPLFLRDGGTIALVRLLKDILSLDSILIGFSSSEDRIHDANESISINMLNKGYEFFKSFILKMSIQ